MPGAEEIITLKRGAGERPGGDIPNVGITIGAAKRRVERSPAIPQQQLAVGQQVQVDGDHWVRVDRHVDGRTPGSHPRRVVIVHDGHGRHRLGVERHAPARIADVHGEGAVGLDGGVVDGLHAEELHQLSRAERERAVGRHIIHAGHRSQI